jgi:hypothetical protein
MEATPAVWEISGGGRVFSQPDWSVRLGILAAVSTTVFVLITSDGATRWGSSGWYLLAAMATGPAAIVIGLRYLVRVRRPAWPAGVGPPAPEVQAAWSLRRRAFAGVALGGAILVPVVAIALDLVAFNQSTAINDTVFSRTEGVLAQAMANCASAERHLGRTAGQALGDCGSCRSGVTRDASDGVPFAQCDAFSLIAVTTSPDWVPLYLGVSVWLLAVGVGWRGFLGVRRRRSDHR